MTYVPEVAPALRAEGFDASEDGSGRHALIASDAYVPEVVGLSDELNAATDVIGALGSGSPSGGGKLHMVLAPQASFVADVAPTLPAGGNATGGERPPGMQVDTVTSLVATTFDFQLSGASDRGWMVDPPERTRSLLANRQLAVSYPLTGSQQRLDGTVETLVPVYPILEAGARTGKSTTDPRAGMGVGADGDPMFTLQSGKQHAVGVSLRGREGGATAELGDEVAMALRASQGGGDKAHVLVGPLQVGNGHASVSDGVPNVAVQRMAMRRLTPRECERLQGMPDDWTKVPYRGKAAEACPDGPRYSAIGNSMAVPVMAWLGRRIALMEEVLRDAAGV